MLLTIHGRTGAVTLALLCLALGCADHAAVTGSGAVGGQGSKVVPTTQTTIYPDGRPTAKYRLETKDHGVVYKHGQGPNQCDHLGARDIWVWEHKGAYYMHYDGAGPKGWLACLATSTDLVNWTAKGPVLELGRKGSSDSASASYGTVLYDGTKWHMFYLGTPNVTPAPEYIPGFPYLTLKAEGVSPAGPWLKRYDVATFKAQPGTYYSGSASPGHVVKVGDEYRMLFAASTDNPILRTLSFARTRNLDGPWTPDPKPFLPMEEQVENSSLYYQKENRTWFLFTNHVGLKGGLEYTDAIWVYWTQDLDHWNPANKAVVLDSQNCNWSKHIIGLPSVVQVGNRLAIFYDGNAEEKMPSGVQSHMNRDIGLAWLDLPLILPQP